MNTKNQQQLNEMLEQLEILQRHSEWIGAVLENLTFLRDMLDCMDEHWECQVNAQILNLESLACATPMQVLNMGESYNSLH